MDDTALIPEPLRPARPSRPWTDAPATRDALDIWTRSYPAGATITSDGDPARSTYIVRAGWLAGFKLTHDGQRQIIDFALPGEIVDPRAGDGANVAVHLETLTEARVATLSPAEWSAMRRAHAGLCDYEHRLIGGLLSRLSERMLRLGRSTAETRLAYALIELFVRLDAIGEVRGGAFRLPLTQGQLGDFTGLSSVHVCRTLRGLVAQGVIDIEHHMHIAIRDMDALATVAGIDPAALAAEIVASPF